MITAHNNPPSQERRAIPQKQECSIVAPSWGRPEVCPTMACSSASMSQRRGLCFLVVIFALAAGSLALKADLVVTTISGGPYGSSGSSANSYGFLDTNNWNSQFNQPYASALDSQGNLYVADRNNHAIRKLTDPTNRDGKTTTFLDLTNKSPVSVAIDAADNLYVLTLEDNLLRKYTVDSHGQIIGMVSNRFVSQPSAMTLARDGSSNAYVALTNGSVWSVSPSGTTNLLTKSFKKPTGLAWMPSGWLAVSDAGNNSIWLLDPTTKAIHLLVGQANLPGGFADGWTNVARFNQPVGIAASGTGMLVVADRGNNRVRSVALDGTVTTLYGIDSKDWQAQYRGWLDSGRDTPPESDQPVSVTISTNGIIYITELGYDLIRTVTGTGLSSTIPPPSTPSFSPSCGYFVGPVIITVSNAIGAVYYTANGTEPTTNSYYLPMTNGVGYIQWASSLDLSWLQVKAFNVGVWSGTVRGGLCPVTTPSFSPTCGYFTNCINVTVNNLVGEVHYTVDGTEPTITSPIVTMTNGVGVIRWCDRTRDLSWLRIKAFSGPSNSSPTVVGEVCLPTAPVFGPMSGYYPDGVTVLVTNTVPIPNYANDVARYTTDGTDPTLDSSAATRLSNGAHQISWNDGLHDLSYLRVRLFAGTNASPVAVGIPSQTNEIGFTQDYYAGPGSTAVIPVVMNLRPNVTVKTILLSVDITPNAPNTNLISTEIQGRRPKTTDFIQVLRPVSANVGDYVMGTSSLTNGITTRLLLSVTPNAGFVVQNHAVVALVCVPLPVAPFGSSWRLALSLASATTDGKTDLPLIRMPSRNLIVSNISYQVGNVTPTAWYSGNGAFGDGNLNSHLKSSDINAVYYVSTGVIVPFNDLVNSASPDPKRKFSDVFDAMDVYPAPDGDGKISFMDSQTILARFYGLDTNILMRSWSANGTRIWTSTNGPRSSLRARTSQISSLAALPADGNVWVCQGRVSSDTLANVTPGQRCSFPVYVDMQPGCRLAGMQLVASVQAESGAPDVGGAQFIPADIAQPQSLDGNTPNDVIQIYPIIPAASFNPPLEGRNHLGDIVFQVPLNAQPKQAYTMHFSSLDGAADLQTPYLFESIPATAWVQATAQRAASNTSDEWKMRFFGSITNDQAKDTDDPDDDGMSNLMEYLAGTDPMDSQSRLQFLSPSVANGGQGVSLTWSSVSSKSYWVEWSPSLPSTNWTAMTNIIGDGKVQQFIDGNAGTQARYYRLRVQAP